MATQSYDKDVEALKGDLRTLRDDVADLGESIRDMAETQARQRYAKVRGKVDGVYDQAVDKADDFTHQFTHQIEGRPLKSVLAALGVGFLIGAILSR